MDADANDDRGVVVRHEDLREAGKTEEGSSKSTNTYEHTRNYLCILFTRLELPVMSLCEHLPVSLMPLWATSTHV